jgi:16S rRNA (cytosine967-C5)-methyltransferase
MRHLWPLTRPKPATYKPLNKRLGVARRPRLVLAPPGVFIGRSITVERMTTPVALSEQMAHAARVVQAVEQGRSLGDALLAVPMALRPGVQALVFHALRHWGQAGVLIGLLADQTPKPTVRALLGVALALLLPEAQTGEGVAYDPHTVVNQAVNALASLKTPRGASGFVNACLRRYTRESNTLLAQSAQDAVARWNHPFWWVQRLRRDHPQHWQALLERNQHAAPMTLRVNRQRVRAADYLQMLKSSGMEATWLGGEALVLKKAVPVEHLPGWFDGHCSVQDAAAQLAAPLLCAQLPRPGQARVLDACAAPGGKTAHLLEQGVATVHALEVDAQRTERIHQNLQRLGLTAQVSTADAGQPNDWWDGEPYDAILLDAPCTASGIVRRHPDVRWLRRSTDVDQLVQQQRRLLTALWPLLKPGGSLLYCTCSVFKAEGAAQMQWFLGQQPEARALAAPGHLLPEVLSASRNVSTQYPLADVVADPMNDNLKAAGDGFFYALLQKTPEL